MSTRVLSLMSLVFLLSACAGSGGGGSSPGAASKPEVSNCHVELHGGETNLEIAAAFNEWGERCSPSEADLQNEIADLK
jgi:ABC-type glycerol-3-phosphate transport system substrate-binding protein